MSVRLTPCWSADDKTVDGLATHVAISSMVQTEPGAVASLAVPRSLVAGLGVLVDDYGPRDAPGSGRRQP